MQYLFQRIIQNGYQWTRPSPGRLGSSGEGEYVQDHGFGHEDWNFNKSLLIGGFIYGYCYYRPKEQIKDKQFNIAFATYVDSQWHLVGFYLNCGFVEKPKSSPEVLRQKMKDLRLLGKSLGPSYKELNDDQFLKKLENESQDTKWRVVPGDAIRLSQPIAIPKSIFNVHNYRITKPTGITKQKFDDLYEYAQNDISVEDYGDEAEFPEGREIESMHKARERNQAVIKKAKEVFKQKHGKLSCEVCGFNFLERYGDIGLDFIEGHHTIPLSRLNSEAKTRPSDIALVCSNCHRMLHRKRPWLEMNELKKLIHSKVPYAENHS